MEKRLPLRRRGHRTLDRGSAGRYRLVCEQLEIRQLLFADPFLDALPDDSAIVSPPIAEGEGSLPDLEIQTLGSLSVSTGTGYKPQSKVWQHDGTWWAAVGGSGTRIWRLDGTKWTSVLTLTSTAYRTDVKSDGDLVHVLLFPDGPATKLVSAEYVPALKTYQLWSKRPQVVDIPLKSGVRIATLDIDSTGRMWVAADTVSTIELHYSEPESNYAVWKGPVTIGTGVTDGDISVVTTLRNGSIGVLWSNQVADRFFFREHRDLDAFGQRNDPASWKPIETVAPEAALNVGGGMADDHLNVAVASNGTLYAGVKTSYDRSGYTMIGALVRRPTGVWDPKLYHVSYNGTRPIIVLNEALGHLMVMYDNVYHESLTDPISFGPARTDSLGSNVTSTKQNWTNELVVLGGGKAVMFKTNATANRTPVAVNDSYSTAEDQTLIVSAADGVLDNDRDPDGDSITAVLVTNPTRGSVTLSSDGRFTYTPAANYFGADSFTYRTQDASASSSPATVSINVTSVNDVPVAVEDSYSVEANQSLTVLAIEGVLKNDSDADSDPLTATLVQDVSRGTLAFNTSGAFTYSPETNYSGSDSFTYKARDAVAESSIVTVTIRINARPIAVGDAYQIDEDQLLSVPALGVLANDSDPDGDALTAQLGVGPSQGTVTLNANGSFSYRPQQDYHGADSFTYRAHDGIDGSQLTTVSLAVNSVNDPPVAVGDSYTAETDQALTIAAAQGLLRNDTDRDADALTAELVSGPTHGTLSVFNSDGSFRYVPNANYEGLDRFTYRSDDGTAESNVAEVSINVVNSSVPLTVSLQDRMNGYSGTRDTRIRGDQTTTNFGTSPKLELDGSPDQVSLIRWDTTGIPAQSTILSVSLTVNVVTTSIQSFEIYESLRAWDELTATFLLAATGKPWAVPGAAGPTDHAAPVLASLTAPSLGLVTVPLNVQGIAVIQKWVDDALANHGIVIQDLADATSDDLDFSSREHLGFGPKLTITYRLTPPPPPNQSPTANADSYTVAEDALLNVNATDGVLKNDTDPEGDALQATLVNGPTKGQLNLLANGSFTYDPGDHFYGSDQFTYRATDSLGNASAITTVTITVISVNDEPTANSKSVATVQNGSVAITLSGSDVDGDPLSYIVDTSPSFGTLTGTAPDLTYVPNLNVIGSDSFTFHISDGVASSATATVNIAVTAVNHPPVADPQTVSTDEDVSTGIVLTGSDVDGNPISFHVETGPTHGSMSGTAPNLSYLPNTNFHGTDQITFKVNDGALDSTVATVTVNVSPKNDSPTANNLSVTTSENIDVLVTLAGNDVDGDSLSYSVTLDPVQGTLSGTAPNLTYRPNAGFVGSDSFTYQAHDGTAPSNTATVTIQVTPARTPETRSFQDGLFPVASYDGTTDSAIRADDQFANFGKRTDLFLDGNPDQATFIRWDLTTIPAGSVVHSASIAINVVNTSINEFSVYELLVPWAETEVTYVQRTSGVPWQISGAQGAADRRSTVLGAFVGTKLGQTVITLNAAGVEAIQRWIDNPSQNHGITVQDFDNLKTDDLDFASSDATNAGTRPKLTLSVTLPAAPKTAAIISPLQNQSNPFDVNNNNYVSPADVLIIFNTLNRIGEGEQIPNGGAFPDVSGDQAVTPLDALMVINFLNAVLVIAEGESDPIVPWLSRESAADSVIRQSNEFPPLTADSGSSTDPLVSCNAQLNGTSTRGLDDDPWSLDLESALQILATDQATSRLES